MQTGHKVLSKQGIEGVRVIDNEPRNTHRKVKETIHIKLRGATFNRTEGYNLPDLYLHLLREEEGGGDQGGQESLTGNTSATDTTSRYGHTP